MTRKEWVMENAPDNIDEEHFFGGVRNCPGDKEYDGLPGERPLIKTECCNEARPTKCAKCWNTEIPVTAQVEPKKDMINPDHYKVHANECIDEIQAMLTPEEFKGFLKGNFLKYRYRTGHKDDPEQEAKKSDWYMNRLIEEENKCVRS